MNPGDKKIDPDAIVINEILLTRMKPGGTCLIIGMRGSGKSTIAENILMALSPHFSHGLIMSKTEIANGFWGKHVPPLYIFNSFNEEACWSLIETQEASLSSNPDTSFAFLVFDDLMAERDFINSQVVKELLVNGRHYRIFVLITTQYSMAISTILRANINYIFMLRDTDFENRKKLYAHYAGIFPNFALFEHVFRNCTDGREAMVIDKDCQSWNVTDTVYYFKAVPALQFQLGNEEYRRFSDEHFNGHVLSSLSQYKKKKFDKTPLSYEENPFMRPVVKVPGNFLRTPSEKYAAGFSSGKLSFMHDMITKKEEEMDNPRGRKKKKR